MRDMRFGQAYRGKLVPVPFPTETTPLRPPAAGRTRFSRFAWGVLAYNVLVVLWGAYVRASGSGAGCGSHWPLCNGAVVPRAASIETLIEYTHRLMSGLALAGVGALCVWSLRLYPRGDRVRRLAGLSAVFLVLEALLGAGLVLFEYVAHNVSVGRAIYLSAHLANTQLLLGMLTATAWLADRPAEKRGVLPKPLRAALGVALFVSITGAIAALGDTLYPAASVAAGLRQEFSTAAHLLVRLRVLHPAIAVMGCAYLLYAALRVRPGGPRAAIVWLAVIQLCAGAVNVALLAPVWMQLVHLLLADLLWIALVVLSLTAA
jgi:heme a synthase